MKRCGTRAFVRFDFSLEFCPCVFLPFRVFLSRILLSFLSHLSQTLLVSFPSHFPRASLAFPSVAVAFLVRMGGWTEEDIRKPLM